MTREEQEFIAKLTGLAHLCGFTLTPEVISLYDQHLGELGYADAARAIDRIIVERRSRDPFPSVKEIREVIRPELRPEDEASEVVGRIVGLVSRAGPYANGVADALGPIAWEIVCEEGGWVTVCELLTYDNMPTLKAQWRRAAEAKLRRRSMSIVPNERRIEDRSQGGLNRLGFDDLARRIGKDGER